MITALLTEVETRDKHTLQGIVIEPNKKQPKTTLIYPHGLGSKFYSGQRFIKELSGKFQKLGIGYFKFNTRGNNIAVRGATKREPLVGAEFENFKKCIYDIETVIKLARKLGYRNIILAGHSTGANKILYYQYKKTNHNIKALLLLGPINYICAQIKTEGRKKLEQGLKIAQRLKNKNPNSLMPKRFGLLSAKRFLSLFSSNSAENVFPYDNQRARWKELKSIKIPVMVAMSENDQCLDREANQLNDAPRSRAARYQRNQKSKSLS